ncbi:putative ribonuclease H-like domain-containing protein, partial [Tanacetum coccineum]
MKICRSMQKQNAPTSQKQALVAQYGLGGYDWSNDFDIEPVNYALMAISSSNSSSSSDNETRNSGYGLSLKSTRTRILGHEKNELAWGEKYEFQNYELKCRELKIDNLKMELEKVVKERDELKVKIEKWEESSKGLNKLLNSQMSAKDKNGLGYGTQLDEISNKSETDRVLTRTGLVNPVRPNRKRTVHTARPISTDRPVSTARPFSLKIAQTSSAINLLPKKYTNGNPEICLQDHAVMDSGFSSHMTGNKAYLLDYEDYNGGFVAFGSDPKGGKITAPRRDDVYSLDLKKTVSSGVESINKKRYCLVVTDDFSRFSWVFFLATKDESSEILYKFIVGLKNQLNHQVKIITCDHGIEFKNYTMNELCAKKGIKREFSVARTPQQNGVAKRKNRTLIEAARTMLADSLLPIPFWAEAVNTACYVLNKVLVTKPQNKTPYELLIGKPFSISFMRPFGCPLTILNTFDPLGKFEGKYDEGYLLGYSTSSKAFRVYNKRTKRVEESLHIDFLEDQPNVAGKGPDWMFDLDFLTNTMNYIPVSVENQVTVDAGIQESYVAGSSRNNKEPPQEFILLPIHPHEPRISVEDIVPDAQEKPFENAPKDKEVHGSEDVAEKDEQHKLTEAEQALKDYLERMVAQEIASKAMDDATRKAFEEEKRNIASQKRAARATSINKLNTGRPSVSTASTPYFSDASTHIGANAGESSFVYLGGQIPIDASTLPNADLPTDPNMPDLEEDSNVVSNKGIFSRAYDDEDVGAEADFNNMDNTINFSPIPTLRIHKDHPKGQILGDPKSAVQTRGKIQKASSTQQALVSYIYKQNKTNHKDHQNCLLACFLSQEEPKKLSQALEDERWVEAMQEELMQFKNKRDERGIVMKNKARLVAQGFRQEEGIDYDEVFVPVSRIEAIRLFLAFASYMGFPVYQMDVKSAFLYGTIGEEVHVHQPPGFVDPAHPNKVYKVVKALYSLHQVLRAWYETLSTYLLENGFRRGTIDKTLFIKKRKSDIMLVQVKQQPNGIFISQDKYVVDILKKFDFWSIRTATTPIESNKPLVKDEDGVDVDVHVYKS